MFVLTVYALVILKCLVQGINIALHAQVSPRNNQIVGSVITTDGLYSALRERFDVNSVSIFYPTDYVGLFETNWDLMVIEGWFRSMHEFIQLTRNAFPSIKIVYFCLDGHYPPFASLLNFDIDGLLTNSAALLQLAAHEAPDLPAQLILLAADGDLMRPNNSVSRDYGAVFVGAGGAMLSLKPGLRQMLTGALPFNLRLHGFHWEHVPVLGAVSQGPLPRFELANAYASAHVVLASTIAAQDQLGMVNNRVFEALSCGAVLVSEHSETLARLLTDRGDGALDLVLFVNATHPVERHIAAVIQNREHFDEVRRQGRAFVLNKHTWRHRAVQLVDYFNEIVGRQKRGLVPRYTAVTEQATDKPSLEEGCGNAAERCSRLNCPRLLWLVSDGLRAHQDYLVLSSGGDKNSLRSQLCRRYRVDVMSEANWLALIGRYSMGDSAIDTCLDKGESAEGSCSLDQTSALLPRYDAVLAIAMPFDALDLSLAVVAPRTVFVAGKDRLQRRMVYILGVDPRLVDDYSEAAGSRSSRSLDRPSVVPSTALRDHFTRGYDVVLYRAEYEVSLLTEMGVQFEQQRLQQAFGLGGEADNDSRSEMKSEVYSVVVCFYASRELCGENTVSHFTSPTGDHLQHERSPEVRLVLLGGEWEAWLVLSDSLRQDRLRNVVHVGEGRWSRAASRLIGGAHRVFIMHAAGVPGAETASSVVWPLVAAAVSASQPRIHLYRATSLLLSAAEQGSSSWTADWLASNVRSVVDKLHGFPPSHSGVMAERLEISTGDSGEVRCFNCDEAEDALLLRSNYLAYLVEMALPDTGGQSVVLRLRFSSFEVGREGEACLAHSGTSVDGTHLLKTTDNKVCLLRPFKYIVVRFSGGRVHREGETVDVMISLSLRGSIFADTVFERLQVLRVDLAVPAWTSGTGRAELHDHRILDDVYVYDVNL